MRAVEDFDTRKSIKRDAFLSSGQKEHLNRTMRTRAPNQGMHESFGDNRNDKNNSTILSVKGDGSIDERLLPVKGFEKPAAMTSLNFYSSKGTTART
jgi:hypothetical protein